MTPREPMTPCRYCEFRTAECHAGCKAYADWLAIHQKFASEKIQQKALRGVIAAYDKERGHRIFRSMRNTGKLK